MMKLCSRVYCGPVKKKKDDLLQYALLEVAKLGSVLDPTGTTVGHHAYLSGILVMPTLHLVRRTNGLPCEGVALQWTSAPSAVASTQAVEERACKTVFCMHVDLTCTA